MKENVVSILKWIWQFPQNITGYVLSRHYYCYVNGVYWKENWNTAGVSLGDYIILNKKRMFDEQVVKHEKGHQKQSLYLGPLYLLVIGLPSVFRNLWDRIFHKEWSTETRNHWYYSGYPENWADKLGGVIRGEL